jgi:hypothetical protein
MEIVQFFEDQRMEYLDALQIILSRLNNEHKYEPIIEPLDQLKNGEEKEDKLFHYFRYDILTKAENNDGYYEIKVNVNPIKFVEPVILRYRLTESLIQSFVWNACVIRFPENQFNPKLLVGWYTKWIKPQQNQIGTTMQEAIHRVSIPDETENKNAILIDFGSIPTLGVIELFDIFSNNRILKLVISSFYE